MRIILDTSKVIVLSWGRVTNITIGGQHLMGIDEKLMREALLFNMELLTSSLECLMSEGDQMDVRIAFFEKRRCALDVLELFDGFMPDGEVDTPGSPFLVNGWQVSADMINVIRQSLMAYKHHKLRGEKLQFADILLDLINGKGPETSSSA